MVEAVTISRSEAAGLGPLFESQDYVRVRFAGDSGDGMQITGTQFATSAALAGNDLATFPDFPAEIRAPAGTTFGVSSYSINFGSCEIFTAGDHPDVLVAMNPAALRMNLGDLRPGGMIVADAGAFSSRNLAKAGYSANPLDDGSLNAFRVIALDISKMTLEAVREFGLSQKEALRCKNMWTLGLMLWMFGRKRQSVIDWLNRRFGADSAIAQANAAALNAGHAFGETAELSGDLSRHDVGRARLEPGEYCSVSGSEALAWGLLAGARLAALPLYLGSYPITPASPLLHQFASLKARGVTTFQAEDEIAAICSAIGAAYGGALGVTTSSGPGIALKTEAIGLALAVELPLVIVNVQRGGPSTGLPTKTEQADLYQALMGRSGDATLPVLAAATPADCFDCAIEAVRLAVKYMTPVILLSDGYLANAAEPWKLPEAAGHEPFPVSFRTEPEGFSPFARDPQTLARPWAIPGTPGLEHRIGGLEKDALTGHVSYDPDNHQRMTDLRAAKINGIVRDIPLQEVARGKPQGDLAVVGWGSTYGPIEMAVRQSRRAGLEVAHIHIRHLWPLPDNLGELLSNYRKVMVVEMNTGQLVNILRAQYLLPAFGLNKVTWRPFKISELVAAIAQAVEG